MNKLMAIMLSLNIGLWALFAPINHDFTGVWFWLLVFARIAVWFFVVMCIWKALVFDELAESPERDSESRD